MILKNRSASRKLNFFIAFHFLMQDLIDFFWECPTPYHYCQHVSSLLEKAGYTRLREEDAWSEIPDKFFVTRRGRAMIAVNKTDLSSGIIFGSHSDSPGLKVDGERVSEGYAQLVTGHYDSAVYPTWIDRDLRIVGRVIFRREGRLVAKVVAGTKPFAFIPSCAVHLVGGGTEPKLKMPNHFHPIVGLEGKERLKPELAALAGCAPEDIVNYDVNLVPMERVTVVGVNDEYLCGAKLDDMVCAYSTTKAFLDVDKPKKGLVMLVVFDNEELGSGTDCGARSNFMMSVLKRIGCPDNFCINSFMASADVCHGLNPNCTKYDDPERMLSLGDGVTYEWGVNGNFAMNEEALNVLCRIAKLVGVPFKPSATKNTVSGGSTIGPHLTAMTGLKVIDFSIPVIGMHSIGETAAVADVENLIKFYRAIVEHYYD